MAYGLHEEQGVNARAHFAKTNRGNAKHEQQHGDAATREERTNSLAAKHKARQKAIEGLARQMQEAHERSAQYHGVWNRGGNGDAGVHLQYI